MSYWNNTRSNIDFHIHMGFLCIHSCSRYYTYLDCMFYFISFASIFLFDNYSNHSSNRNRKNIGLHHINLIIWYYLQLFYIQHNIRDLFYNPNMTGCTTLDPRHIFIFLNRSKVRLSIQDHKSNLNLSIRFLIVLHTLKNQGNKIVLNYTIIHF